MVAILAREDKFWRGLVLAGKTKVLAVLDRLIE